MSDKTTTIMEWARAAKRANEASGEDAIRDELLIRAASAWLVMSTSLEFLELAMPGDSLARTLCILHIASSFHDVEPSTPQRAALFCRKIDTPSAEG